MVALHVAHYLFDAVLADEVVVDARGHRFPFKVEKADVFATRFPSWTRLIGAWFMSTALYKHSAQQHRVVSWSDDIP
jgi:hypothetical protein